MNQGPFRKERYFKRYSLSSSKLVSKWSSWLVGRSLANRSNAASASFFVVDAVSEEPNKYNDYIYLVEQLTFLDIIKSNLEEYLEIN